MKIVQPGYTTSLVPLIFDMRYVAYVSDSGDKYHIGRYTSSMSQIPGVPLQTYSDPIESQGAVGLATHWQIAINIALACLESMACDHP